MADNKIEKYDWMGLLRGAVDVSKNGFISNDEAERRFDHCRECPFLNFNNQCRKCGCMMNIKVKIKGAKCPIGIW